ncbi:MAG: sigma factor-like helix-turn-helix DNA-binding protein [Christensenella sp.]|uniref:YlxM family DNA-binding protein n=1 Tax=Christensenella sp. TaxID=1935934 RepID=UPI002B215E55|nr:sigma factor-like helix-turn-helix DNA-binding protein [Christensenella sp.]MEA5004556.1 sigma factor-like helix-turn-helix DNA-binding protein [Christensenella sp.]
MKREKDLKLSLYYDFYGEFLTQKQASVFSLYYNDDYSLAEIAQECGISRQGVLDTIKRAQVKLEGMEQKLGLVKSQLDEEK